jgi:hypothetical protein
VSVNVAEIVAAIQWRLVVELRYDVDAARIVHPHVLFRAASGEEHLDTYQVGGFTHHGALPGWRLFTMSRIVSFRALEAVFDIAPGYNPGSSKYSGGVIASVR